MQAAAAEDIRKVRGRLRGRRLLVVAALVVLLPLAMLAGIAIGPVTMEAGEILSILASKTGLWKSDADPMHAAVIWNIRFPRVLLAVLVGAGLGCAGAALQGLFRNPLADPGLIGISSGAGMAAAAVIVLGAPLMALLPGPAGAWLLPLAAFGGGLAVTLLIYRLATHEGRTVVATMLLAGIAINALAGSVTGLFTFLSTDDQLRSLTFWLLGSLGGANWQGAGMAAVFLLPALALLIGEARTLNALLLGEAEARHLGFDPQRSKRRIIVWCALAVGATVALCGVIGFIGLVVPHLVRLMLGPDHRFVMPCSALLGGLLLVLADLAARNVVAPAELPIGILTALLGAPFFLWLLLRQRAAWG